MYTDQDILRQSSVSTLSKSKKKVLLASLDELMERMPSLLDIDHPFAQRQIADARRVVEVCKTSTFSRENLYSIIVSSLLEENSLIVYIFLLVYALLAGKPWLQ